MTQNITAQQCKTELENILKDAIEKGKFNYKVHASDKFFLWGEDEEIEIVLAEENETKEIYVDDEHTLFFDDEDTKVCKVKRKELFNWGSEEACHFTYRDGKLHEWYRDRFDFDGELYGGRKRKSKISGLGGHSEINYIITQLIVAKRLEDVQRFTLEQFVQMFGKCKDQVYIKGNDSRTFEKWTYDGLECESYEWDIPENEQEVYVFGTLHRAAVCTSPAPFANLIDETLRRNEPWNCYYFKCTYGDMRKACEGTDILYLNE